jgi:hypothetical protein
MWSNLLQAGTTVRLDARRAWSASVLGSYEFHSAKKDTDITVGNIMTIEGGLARSLYQKVSGTPLPRVITLGVPYYSQFKVTADSTSVDSNFLAERKDHVFGVGAEGSVFLPQAKLLLGARFVSELGAANRTQGYTLTVTVAYQAQSLAKAAAP